MRYSGARWLQIHSGHGDSVELDHYNDAVRSIQLGLSFIDPDLMDTAVYNLQNGYQAFVNNHKAFFKALREEIVGRSIIER